MVATLMIAAGIAFLFWRTWRARENAAERRASGLSLDPLYWVDNALALSAVGVSLIIAKTHLGFTGPGLWVWIVAITLMVGALWVRRVLKWRYPL